MSARKAASNPETDTPKDPRNPTDTKFHLAALFEQTDSSAARSARKRFGEDYSAVPALRQILAGLAELSDSQITVKQAGFAPLVSLLEKRFGEEGTWVLILEQIRSEHFAVGSHLEYWEGIVSDAISRWRAMKGTEMLWHALTNGNTPAQRIEMARSLYQSMLDGDDQARQRCCPMADRLADLSETACAPQQRKLRTGLWTVDNMTGGIAPGEVLTCVARTRVGKSAFGIQVLVNAALNGILCVLFSMEMPAEQALERILQAAFGLTDKQVREHAKTWYKNLTPEQTTILGRILKYIVIIDGGKCAITDLDSGILEATAYLGGSPSFAVLDHLGLMGSGAKNVPMYQRISEAACDVKSWAKRHRLAVVLLCQTGRSQDKAVSEGAAYIGLDAARDSGQVEEFADFLLTLWRPELRSILSPAEKAAVAGQLKGHLCKNRRGDEPLVHFHFDRPTQRITDPIPGDES